MIHFPRFFSSRPTLSRKRGVRVRRPSTEDRHVPQGFEPLDDALAHACGENAPCDDTETAVRRSASKKRIKRLGIRTQARRTRSATGTGMRSRPSQRCGRKDDRSRITGSTAITSELEIHVMGYKYPRQWYRPPSPPLVSRPGKKSPVGSRKSPGPHIA